jgi:hypothetical protein
LYKVLSKDTTSRSETSRCRATHVGTTGMGSSHGRRGGKEGCSSGGCGSRAPRAVGMVVVVVRGRERRCEHGVWCSRGVGHRCVDRVHGRSRNKNWATSVVSH